jgi:hypothetical protein
MPGVIEVGRAAAIRRAIEGLLLLTGTSREGERRRWGRSTNPAGSTV